MKRKMYSNPEIKVVNLPCESEVMTDSLTNINNDILTGDDYEMNFNL